MLKFISTLLLVLSLSHTAFAQSDITIDLGKAKTKKSLLAFPPLQYIGSPAGSRYQLIGAEIFSVVTNDLSVAPYFQFISQKAYLEDTSKTGLTPFPGNPKGFKFQNWTAIGAEFLIRGSFSTAGNDLSLEMYVYNVGKAQLVMAKKYKGTIGAARRIAHTFSNDVLESLTGTKGMYLSKIAVASDRAGSKFKELYTMDWDGANPVRVTTFQSIVLSPAWSPDAKRIAFTAYVTHRNTKLRNADLFVYEIKTGKRTMVSFQPGINSGASFSPDGKNIFLTISQTKSPDIYKMSVDGSDKQKITNGPMGALNVEPAVSPDGSKIAFSSDRAGRPMIYVMNTDGSNPKRITFAGAYNSSPAWSPDGKKIAFAAQDSNNFDIFVMNADGTGMIRLTSAKKTNGKMANNEDPSFSPDGRFVIYTSDRSGANQIYMSTVDGSEERRITQDNFNYFKPRWSINIE